MREIHRHMEIEELERYSLGASSVTESLLVEEHLLTCEACRTVLQETDDYVLAMRMASRQVREAASTKQSQGRFSGWFPNWFPAAAAVFCGLLLVAALVLRGVPASGPAVAVSLTAMRGSGAGNTAPAGRELLLHPDLTGLVESPSYRLEIVDLTAHPARQGTLPRTQDGIRFPGLSAGMYFVRVYLPGGQLLREYGLDIR